MGFLEGDGNIKKSTPSYDPVDNNYFLLQSFELNVRWSNSFYETNVRKETFVECCGLFD